MCVHVWTVDGQSSYSGSGLHCWCSRWCARCTAVTNISIGHAACVDKQCASKRQCNHRPNTLYVTAWLAASTCRAMESMQRSASAAAAASCLTSRHAVCPQHPYGPSDALLCGWGRPAMVASVLVLVVAVCNALRCAVRCGQCWVVVVVVVFVVAAASQQHSTNHRTAQHAGSLSFHF